MKTKFILHGGSGTEFVKQKKQFENLFLGINDEAINVLVFPFCMYKENWERGYTKYLEKFGFLNDIYTCHFEIAKLDNKILTSQIEKSHIILINGGGEDTFFNNLTEINFKFNKSKLKDKIVFGTSAGANILSKYYYSNDRSLIGKGSGILSINTICHYDGQKYEKLKLLEKSHPEYKTLRIKEDEFICLGYDDGTTIDIQGRD